VSDNRATRALPCPDGNTACDGTDLLHGPWCVAQAWARLAAAAATLGAAWAEFKLALDAYTNERSEIKDDPVVSDRATYGHGHDPFARGGSRGRGRW
jgi:hypothetical protein